MAVWAGFDVGGQSIKAVVIDAGGKIVARGTRPTGLEVDAAGLAHGLRELIEELAMRHRPAGRIGVGVAGVMGADGVLQGSPNLPRLVGERVEPLLARALECPVVVDNDANCAAFGEGLGGVADGLDDYLLVTLGSGIGSGLVLGGRVYHGSTGYACELGHTIVHSDGRTCGCGNRGCLEAYCSESAARAATAEASGRLRRCVEASVREGAGHAQALFALAGDDDGEAREITSAMITMLGTGLASAVNLIDVTTLVVGGGIGPAVMKRRGELIRALNASLFARDASAVTLLAAARGGDAGAVGAARLAMSAR